jgi:hypothetical protein
MTIQPISASQRAETREGAPYNRLARLLNALSG